MNQRTVAIYRLAIAAALTCSWAAIGFAQEIAQPVVRTAEPRVSAPTNLREAAVMRVWQPGDPIEVKEDLERVGQLAPRLAPLQPVGPDVLLPNQFMSSSAVQPTVVASFAGIPATGFVPPDVVGAVGRSHYIQMANVAFAIFDKNGQLLAGPSLINSVWRGFGGPC